MGDMYRPSRIVPLGGVASGEKALDDIVSRNILGQLRRNPPPRHETKPQSGRNDDHDIVASMAKRLGILEKELKEKNGIMQRVHAENDALKSKLKVSEEEIQRKASAPAAPSSGSNRTADEGGGMHTRSEAARLRAQVRYAWRQVAEMKDFLNDYGLVWVGEPDLEGLAEPQPGAAAAAAKRASQDGDIGALPVGRGAVKVVSAQTDAASSNDNGTNLPPRPPAQERAFMGPRRRLSSAGGPGSSSVGTSAGGAPEAAAPSSQPPPASGVSVSSSPAHSWPLPQLPFSIEKLRAAVDELNQLAGDGIGQLVGGGRGASGPSGLKTPEPVRLVLFQDGLQVHRAPVRPYSDPASVALLKDVLDGYFPITLKAEFPDGVPIKVVDRTSETTAAASAMLAAAAAARGGSKVHSFQDLEDAQAGPLPRDKFLSKLPQTVIKNGKVIDIRGEVGKLVGAAQPGGIKVLAQHVSTPADALLTTSQRNHLGPILPPPSREAKPGASASGAGGLLLGSAPDAGCEGQQRKEGQEIATLQVKSEDGRQTFILKMQYDDSIFALRKCIDAHRGKLAKEESKPAPSAKYEIRGAFPARAYGEAKETLREAGLVPNGTLFLRAM